VSDLYILLIISRCSKAFLAGASSNLSRVVEIDEFTVSRCHIFVSEITSVLITYYDDTPIWIPAGDTGTNKDDLECPIQLKVHMSHGLLADSVDTSLARVYII